MPPITDPGGLTVGDASPEVAGVWAAVAALAHAGLPSMGLDTGLRPAADVDVLLRSVSALEYGLAVRMAAAERAGALPLVGPGAMARGRAWSSRWCRRLARTGGFVLRYPQLAGPWAAGLVTSEHVEAVARFEDDLTGEQLAAVLEQLAGRWGMLTPEAVGRFMARVVRMLRPPPDPDPEEQDAYAGRCLSFAVLGDSVLLSGTLPRLEGAAVIAAVDAWAERLRSAADQVPAAARRADGLVALVNHAAAADTLPNRGGLPVALSVTVDLTGAGEPVWTSSGGHAVTEAEARFAACSADLTPIAVRRRGCEGDGRPTGHADSPSVGARIAALAHSLLDTGIPLAVGRTQRHATPGQRRALAARDRGCIIPGCRVPAEACQAHHLDEWAAGGHTDLDRLTLLCWTHHRQVDLGMWTIEPADPDDPVPPPTLPAPPGTRWPANNGSPWIVRATPRSRWRL